jgi:hypothetical protein
MTNTWIVAFSLLAVLVGLETVLLLAVMRQIGVLSMRIKPIPALVDDEAGPTPGTVLADVALEAAANADGLRPFAGARSLLFFVSPTCSLCGSLLKPLAAVQKSYPELDVFLAAEEEPGRAAEYAKRSRTRLPLFVAPDLFRAWEIEGTPFALIADRERRILRSGVVNTLEQLEVLIESLNAPEHVHEHEHGADFDGDDAVAATTEERREPVGSLRAARSARKEE